MSLERRSKSSREDRVLRSGATEVLFSGDSGLRDPEASGLGTRDGFSSVFVCIVGSFECLEALVCLKQSGPGAQDRLPTKSVGETNKVGLRQKQKGRDQGNGLGKQDKEIT